MSGLLALVGPTATGKSAVALSLAERLGAEIVCVDSMTIYRELNVGTAKPSASDRARVPHQLLDLVSVSERMTVARYQRRAREVLDEVKARARAPLVAGGSGLYFRAVVDSLSFPPTDPVVRARLDAGDTPALVAALQSRDPEAAAFIDPGNRRRIVRALEVIELTGRPFSSFRDDWNRYEEVTVAGLTLEQDQLGARIEHRLRSQLDAGLLDEVRALCDAGHREDLLRLGAIPYPDAIACVEGALTTDDFLERAARATRRLARRQSAWFRRDPRVRWFDAADLERAAVEVGAYYGRRLEGDRR